MVKITFRWDEVITINSKSAARPGDMTAKGNPSPDLEKIKAGYGVTGHTIGDRPAPIDVVTFLKSSPDYNDADWSITEGQDLIDKYNPEEIPAGAVS